MKIPVFWKLCGILQERLENGFDSPIIKNYNSKKILNGPISHSLRISIAIRYLAGGLPLDIALVHGVSH
jgi:hypothetical protein